MEKQTPTTEIVLIDHGPMIVTGPFELIGTNGEKIKLDPSVLTVGVALCRCGKSRKMPLCDGAHLL